MSPLIGKYLSEKSYGMMVNMMSKWEPSELLICSSKLVEAMRRNADLEVAVDFMDKMSSDKHFVSISYRGFGFLFERFLHEFKKLYWVFRVIRRVVPAEIALHILSHCAPNLFSSLRKYIMYIYDEPICEDLDRLDFISDELHTIAYERKVIKCEGSWLNKQELIESKVTDLLMHYKIAVHEESDPIWLKQDGRYVLVNALTDCYTFVMDFVNIESRTFLSTLWGADAELMEDRQIVTSMIGKAIGFETLFMIMKERGLV